MTAEQLKKKLERHESFYVTKKAQLNQLDIESKQWLHRYSRLLTHSNLTTKLIIKLNTQMMIEAFKS